jgi:CRP/FNR family cyclic AMP-dependent transcriptional regulator
MRIPERTWRQELVKMDFFWSLPKTSLVGLEHSFSELFGSSQTRHYDAGTILSDPSSTPDRAFSCTSGTLKVTKLLSNGREILITILESGSVWSDRSLLKGYWREVFVETMSPADVISIERESFERALYSHPERLTQFMTKISEQMSDALTLLEDFRGRDVASRLASVLVRFSKQHGVKRDESVVIDLPFTHQDLANMIGTARETVSRNMARFRAEGYVRDTSAATLEILNLSSLEALV